MPPASPQPDQADPQPAGTVIETQDLVDELQAQIAQLRNDLTLANAGTRALRREKLILAQGLQALEAQVRELGAQPVTDPTPRKARRSRKSTAKQ